jgi:hypothetical protein
MEHSNDILIQKLDNAGIDKLVSIYGEQFKRRLTNMKASSIPLEKRKNLIITKILECVVKSDDNTLSQKIIDTYFPVKEKKEKPVPTWINDFVVGEEVMLKFAPQDKQFSNIYTKIHRKGKVLKINKKSISVGLFGYDDIDDMDAIKNQTYGFNKLVWLNFINGKMVVFNRNEIVKKGEMAWIDEEFIVGKRRVDWGN